MGVRLWAALCAAVGLWATGATAAETINFSVGAGDVITQIGDPYGVDYATSPVTGSFTVTPPSTLGPYQDLTPAITDFTFSAGSTSWSSSDLVPSQTIVWFNDYGGTEQVDDFDLVLPSSGAEFLITPSGAQIVDGSNVYYCSQCVSFTAPVGDLVVPSTAVPEPSVWLLATLGLGLTGVALRRRRRLAALA